MEYLLPIFLCLLFSALYDQAEGGIYLGESKKSKTVFNFIFAWLVFLSALQYCVGYDIPIYMKAYQANSNMKLTDIWGDVRYRPGWLFLQFLCHKISDDFVVLKIIQALFLNICVYSFLSRYSRYWYLTLFFYILYSYGPLNFGAMRQSFAVGFFLLAVPYLEEKGTRKKNIIALFKYLFLSFAATLFHVSAFVLFFVPILKICVSTTKRTAITITFVIIGSFIISRIPNIRVLLYSLLQSSSTFEENARYYLTGNTYEINRSGLALIKAFVPVSFIYICLYLNRIKRDSKHIVLQMLLLAYIIMATFNLFIPIFYRFNDYFVFSYIVLIPMAIYEGVLPNQSFPAPARSLLYKAVLFFMFVLYPVHQLVFIHPAFGFPGYRIYYPYHSVFDPQIDPKRDQIINL